FVLFALGASHAESAWKEFRSPLGVAKLFLPPQASGGDSDSSEIRPVSEDTGAVSPIGDLKLPGETLLLVYFQDGYSGEEVRFPVRLSQMQRFWRDQAKKNQTGARDERIVAGIRELSRNLKVRMRTVQEPEGAK